VTLLDEEPVATTAAGAQAERNRQANLAALEGTQPWLVECLAEAALDDARTWIFGRDGFLTTVDATGRWFGGCSLPKRAGAAMLRRLELRGVVGCLLAPTHAGQVAAALEKLTSPQAVLVVQPDLTDLGVMLACADFSEEIARHRLWLAGGLDWDSIVLRIFQAHPGLPTPTQFIRTVATAQEVVQGLIPRAEECFKRSNEARWWRVRELRDAREAAGSRLGCESKEDRPGDSPALNGSTLVVAPTHFRLWDDGGFTLRQAFVDARSHLDPDDPAEASAVGLALAAEPADAIVTLNKGRADLPDALPSGKPLVTWVTHPCIPAFDPACPQDGLLLGDEAWLPFARAAGWPEDRLRAASWPEMALPPPPNPATLVLIADTTPLETPIKELDFSSHHVLWESIRHDLAHDPFCIGGDLDAFLARRRSALHIGMEGFDRTMFIERLIVPAWQQAVARLLLDAGLPLKLYGGGWDELPGLRDHWEGPVRTREQFLTAAGSATALVYPWPMRYRGAIDAVGRGVLWTASRDPRDWVRQARAMLREAPATPREEDSLVAGVRSLIG
jgi:hypothetical protein